MHETALVRDVVRRIEDLARARVGSRGPRSGSAPSATYRQNTFASTSLSKRGARASMEQPWP